MSTILVAVPCTFAMSPLPGCRPSACRCTGPQPGVRIFSTPAVYTTRAGGTWEASGRSGATVPGRSSFCNKAGPGAPRVDMLKSATRLVFHSLPAAGRTPVLVAGTLRFSRCTFVIFRKYLALYQKYLAIPQISGGFVGSYR